MKSLLELQREIRKLENDVEHIMENIHNINKSIDEMRNGSGNIEVDYSGIKIIAKNMPFKKHPIIEIDEEAVVIMYLEILLNIVRMGSKTGENTERLVFMQWMLNQTNVSWTLEELINNTYKLDTKDYLAFVEGITGKYREQFVLDALLVANVQGNAMADMYAYIVNVGEMLAVSKERLKILSIIAKGILCQSFYNISHKDFSEILKCSQVYKNYLPESVLEETRVNFRNLVVKAPLYDVRNFEWKKSHRDWVNNGEVVADYWDRKSGKYEKVVAYRPGTIFEFRDQYVNYGVIAHESDDKFLIEEWVKSMKR